MLPHLDSYTFLNDRHQKSLQIRAAGQMISAPQRRGAGGGAESWGENRQASSAQTVSRVARATRLGPCGLRPLSQRKRRCTLALAAVLKHVELGGGAGQLRGSEETAYLDGSGPQEGQKLE